MQWHPIFADLLRPLMQDYYEVLTEVPVGDLPREADLLLLRRRAPAPFVSIWRHLTTWNVMEFKGPSDDPPCATLTCSWKSAYGIDRRLNEERLQDKQPLLERGDMSWWFLVNHVGQRLRAEARAALQSSAAAGRRRAMAWRSAGASLLAGQSGHPADRSRKRPAHLVTQEPIDRVAALVREEWCGSRISGKSTAFGCRSCSQNFGRSYSK